MGKSARIGVVVLLVIWTALPVYTMVKLSLSAFVDMYDSSLWPKSVSLESFIAVFTESSYYVDGVWEKFANSLIVASAATALTLAIASLAGFAVSRLRPWWGTSVSSAALTTYVIPLAFLAIPLFKVMTGYRLLDSLWSLILAQVAWCVPYGIWIFSQYAGQAIPKSLDESARIDGASSWRLYTSIYMPLMKPVLVAIGAFTFLSAWNEYLLAYLLLNSDDKMTVPVMLAGFLNTDQPPVNILMATSIIYSLPPIAIYLMFQRNMTSGLGEGAIKQ